MKAKITFIVLSIIGSFWTHDFFAREDYKVIKKEKVFFNRLHDYPFIVALFISLDKRDPSKDKNNQQKNEFMYASGDRFYTQANVQFLLIDMQRKELNSLASTFKVNQLPSIILFKDGNPLRNNNKKLIVLTGFSNEDTIKDFIDRNLAKDIEKYSDWLDQIRKDEQRQREIDRENYRPYLNYSIGFPGYGYPACNYGWPYNTGYGYNCGNYGYCGYPSFSFGVNVPL